MTYRNLVEMHRCQCERFGPRTALRYKRYGLFHGITWNQYRADALACAAALVDVGIKPGERVGLLAENRFEWLITDMGILTAGAVNVSPHAPLTARQVHFQFDDAGVRWAFASNREQADKIRQVRKELPQLQGLVVFDRNAAEEGDILWSSFLQRGRHLLGRLAGELAKREADLKPDVLATIMYTSGTTGNPKGVMLTHGNLVTNSESALAASPHEPDDVVLNWLPYSHIYARNVDHYQKILAGVVLCLAESAETVIDDIKEIQPMHIASVPRLYEKCLTAVASDDPKETARRLRKLFGPRIDWLSSGGAPLPKPVAEAYHAAGLLVLQGYGLTETSPVISFNRKSKYKLDTVGQPIPGVEVKIAPDGEVLSRGSHIMPGYWNNPAATAEAIQDGWFHTGDLGELDADGFLKITGRKKELLVLSNGKKVVPTFIEGLLVADPCIDQAVVYGEMHNFLSAIIVPQWDNVRHALHEKGTSLNHDKPESLAKNEAVCKLLQKHIDAALVDVAGYEKVKKFIVLPKPLSVEGEELTVSLKIRREIIFKKYRGELEALYKE